MRALSCPFSAGGGAPAPSVPPRWGSTKLPFTRRGPPAPGPESCLVGHPKVCVWHPKVWGTWRAHSAPRPRHVRLLRGVWDRDRLRSPQTPSSSPCSEPPLSGHTVPLCAARGAGGRRSGLVPSPHLPEAPGWVPGAIPGGGGRGHVADSGDVPELPAGPRADNATPRRRPGWGGGALNAPQPWAGAPQGPDPHPKGRTRTPRAPLWWRDLLSRC